LKRKKTVSKHDIIRALKAILSDIQILAQRVTMMESVLFNYIEMRKDDKKLMKYMEKNVKRTKEETKED
jgi:hypothetical protein|tara:strand:+ start:736 stop:942 length:207 start_codon:yes stop_codon:yes gene_type:complete